MQKLENKNQSTLQILKSGERRMNLARHQFELRISCWSLYFFPNPAEETLVSESRAALPQLCQHCHVDI